MKKKANAMHIESRVIFTGVRVDANRLFQAMDCYIFPSLWEGLGISLVEAQASGLKCICSENIPQECVVTQNVKMLQLKAGAGEWVEHIARNFIAYGRKNTYSIIVKSGYDIAQTASWMQKFYIGLTKE